MPPLRTLHSADSFLYQISGDIESAPVVYLPGVHGCWTPLDQARAIFGRELRFIEVAYPLYDNWSLDHYAEALLTMLNSLGISSAHIIGESFGSLVAWQFGSMYPSQVRSHILIGGFSQAPGMYLAGTAGIGLSMLPAQAFDKIVDSYVAYKKFQGEPRNIEGVKAYPAVRGSRGQKATANRMRIIQQTDFLSELSNVAFPVRYIGGSSDSVISVKREISTLQRLLPETASFESYLIPDAPHAIIASHAEVAVKRITRWVQDIEENRR